MLVFEERGKPEFPEKNLSEQSREPTNSAHIWRRVRESNPGHIGGRRALSPLHQPCSPMLCKFFPFFTLCKSFLKLAGKAAHLSHGFISVEVAEDPVLSKYVQKPIKISFPFDRMSFRVPSITKMTENTQLKFQLSSDQKMWNLPWHTTFKYPQWVIRYDIKDVTRREY